MKRFTTNTDFVPLSFVENDGMKELKKDGKLLTFKTRKAVENFCQKNKTLYVERKYIFYR